MKKASAILILLLLFLSLSSLYAVDKKGEQSLPIGLTEEEKTRLHEIGIRHKATAPPLGVPRNPAEWEPSEGVIIRWPLGISVALIAEMSEDLMVTTICANASEEQSARNAYTAGGVNMSNVDFIHAPSDSIWTRDYGPWFIFEDLNLAIVDHIYNRPRPNDDVIPQVIGAEWSLNVYGMDLIHTGGNHMSEGLGTSMSTELVYNENPAKTPVQVDQLMYEYLGNDYTVLDYIQQSGIHHIDCWAKLLNPTTVMVKDVPPSDPTYDDLNERAAFLATQISAWGVPYTVVRVYCPSGTYYTNSIILNNKVLVPIFGNSQDSVALQRYQDAMPGYEVLGFTGSWATEDALHCRVMGVPDHGMLFIDHVPFRTEDITVGDYLITATIVAHSGTNLVSDGLRIYYSVDGSPWTYTLLTAGAEPDSYEGYIPVQPEGSVISYYLEAADESGRVERHPYIGQAWAHQFIAICMNHPLVNVMPDGPLPVCTGSGKLLTADLTGGTGPFTFQWMEDGSDVFGATSATYTATSTGTHIYNCKVWGDGCISPKLDDDDVQLTWQTEPVFAGLTAVASPQYSLCTMQLSWNSAIPACGGPVDYNVYRSTTPGFIPSPTNLLVSGLTATSFTDTNGLISGTTYYYIVRAVDTANSVEDANLVERSGTPGGPASVGDWLEDGEGTPKFTSTGLWHLANNSSCISPGYQSPTHAYYYGQDATCNYNNGSANSGTLTSVTVSGVTSSSSLSFWSYLRTEQEGSGYDNARVQISTDAGGSWLLVDQDASNGGTIPDGGGSWYLRNYAIGSYNGNDVLIRFYFNTSDNQYNNFTGWFLDDIAATNVSIPGTCTTGGGVVTVPSGTEIGTTPLLAAKNGNALQITWDVSTANCSSSGYHLIWGYGNDLASYTIAGSDCTLMVSGSHFWNTVPDTSSDWCWFLVVGNDGSIVEGGWGTDSTGIQRSNVASGQCGTSIIDTAPCNP
ncbi:MAG: hypothetical protein A2Y62_04310 [Candidatus Fischerbacteria bacterium RBG_13_37_8]|uniref:Fibronectin type-III domain-containing protein n=1 Tax=Candidatus Fischerbacteria bacterium RBG_13_37_8 TaxID=1817863 RepID=A0A1F5VFW0_9BACT|nr:MAG: hypothetical protein A2Y62_04310 [Candidatus Fischerbacteria bacterium RBG_13_37_8]